MEFDSEDEQCGPVIRFYLERILSPLFIFCFKHVPMFAEYAVTFVYNLDRRVHALKLKGYYIDEHGNIATSLPVESQ